MELTVPESAVFSSNTAEAAHENAQRHRTTFLTQYGDLLKHQFLN
jgi:hypothetical protein